MTRPTDGPTGGAAGTGGTGEGLGDRHPLGGGVTFDDEAGVSQVAALGDDQAEVERRALDAVGLGGGPPTPTPRPPEPDRATRTGTGGGSMPRTA